MAVLPADQHRPGTAVQQRGCQLRLLPLGEFGGYRDSDTVGQAADGLVGPVVGGLAPGVRTKARISIRGTRSPARSGPCVGSK